jgi:hypothetical protein
MLYAQPDVDPRKFSNRLSNLGIHQTKMDYHLPFPNPTSQLSFPFSPAGLADWVQYTNI